MKFRPAILGLAVLAACSAAGAAAVFEAGNTPPNLAAPGRVETFPDQPSAVVEFSISDAETPAENLIVSASISSSNGSNPRLLRPEGILLGGSGHTRTLQVIPELDEHGFVSVVLTVEDEHGGTASYGVELWIKDFSSYLVASPLGGVLVDVDGDGWLDLLGHISWRRNVGGTNTASSQSATMPALSVGAFVLADVIGDNTPDYATVGTHSRQPPEMRIFTRRSGPLPGYSAMQNPVGPGFSGPGALSWGDFDLDGDMDLFAFGATNRNFAPGHMVWRNDGGIAMSEVESNLPNMAASFAAWNDYNLDGAPDFFLAGTTNGGIQGRISRLMLNDGQGWFTTQPLDIAGMGPGALISGDVDNDGRPDIFFGASQVGAQGATTNLVAIFKNMEDGTFEPLAYFESLLVEGAVLFDFNNDGLLDLLYFGEPIQSFRRRLKIYINAGAEGFQDISQDPLRSNQHLPYPLAIGDFDRDGRVDVVSTGGTIFRNNASRTNTPPGAPAELKAEVQGNEVLLSWVAATDENQSGGLTYNLRVGTQPGGTDIMSPLADVETSRRFIVSPGNAYQALRRKLRLLEPGTYYWSVQAVDHAYAGGAFAPEAAFEIAGGIFAIEAFRIEGASGLLTLQIDSAGVVAVERSENLRDWDLDQIIELPAGSSVIELPLSDNGAGDKPRFFRLRRDAAE